MDEAQLIDSPGNGPLSPLSSSGTMRPKVTGRAGPSLAAFIRLHFAPKDLIHIRLILLSAPSEPVEDVGIDSKADQLLDGPKKTSHLNV